ncbi:MAG: NADH:flavin oxidoreductase [Marinifilaceae bacterium]
MNSSKILNVILALCLLVLSFKIALNNEKSESTNSQINTNKDMKTLLDKTQIGGLNLKNRFIRASIGDKTSHGFFNKEKTTELYVNLAKGGVGTILSGYTVIDEKEKEMDIFAIYDDKFIPQYSELTKLVKQNGANFLMQLVQVGSNNHMIKDERLHTVFGMSAVANLKTGIMPKEMTVEEIKDLINKFAQAAVRAKKSGFDGIEIHASHGYLLHQSATSYYNRRTDEYGGSRENRYRLTVEVYEAIRKAVGNDFPIWIKIHSEDSFEGGITHEDCLYICQELDKRGIDAIEISGDFWSGRGNRAYYKEIASKVADQISAPVIVTGGNRDFDEMKKMINETNIGYLGLARPLMQDPEMINKYVRTKSE